MVESGNCHTVATKAIWLYDVRSEIEFRIKQSTELTEFLQGHDKFFKWVISLAFIYIGKYWVSVKIRAGV